MIDIKMITDAHWSPFRPSGLAPERRRGMASANGRIVMIICSSSRRYLLLAGTIGTLAVAVWPAAAQQTPAASEAPPPWAQGRSETAIGARLAPIAPPPLPTASDQLPIAKLKVTKGSKIA